MSGKGQVWKILELLEAHGELCGIDMAERDAALSGMGIYVVLGRMEKQGLIDSHWKARAGVAGRGVKLFWLKPEGRLRLRAGRAAEGAMAGQVITVDGRVI
jgi:predicted ArsR family transcriptional regulator